MMTDITWIKKGNEWEQTSSCETTKRLEKKVYNLEFDNLRGIYLSEFSEEFNFPFKLYGLERKFIDHVMTTFHNTKTNLGILLNGKKGTGKTVCAKTLANAMGLPVIIISVAASNLVSFLNNINQPCICMFDEFEKTFEDSAGRELLSIMDGVFSQEENRKIFILTTNNLKIDDNLISRPSRIRYKKTFGNLPIETVQEYIDDKLIDKSKKDSIIEFVNTLELSTIDILKAIVDEINLHKCDITEFKSFFNVTTANYRYKILIKRYCPLTYNLDSFKNDIAKIGTPIPNKEADEDNIENGETTEIGDKTVVLYQPYHFGINQESATTSINISYLRQGDSFSRGVVHTPIDSQGFMVLEDEYDGSMIYIKVENFETKPSLYKDLKFVF